jgi:predicted nucleic acid-binding protein
MMETANSLAVVIDANILIAICSKEEGLFEAAQAVLSDCAERDAEFFAPHVIVSEVLFVFCRKEEDTDDDNFSKDEHVKAIEAFSKYLTIISFPQAGDASLIERAVESRKWYRNFRRYDSSDGLYIALAEKLSQTRSTEFITRDKDLKKILEENLPIVKVKEI